MPAVSPKPATLRNWLGSRIGGLSGVFWTVWWGLVVNRLASFVLPFLSIYLVRDRGFLPAQAGRVLALYGLGMTIAGPLGGLLADRIGRRATMLVALVLGASAAPVPGRCCCPGRPSDRRRPTPIWPPRCAAIPTW